MHPVRYALLLLMLLPVAGCNEDEPARKDDSSRVICFATSMSRSMPATEVESMGCMAYSSGGLYIDNAEFRREGGGTYTCDDVYYWPGSHMVLDFYNYAPYGAEGLTVPSDAKAPRVLEYRVPDRAENQSDLMLARALGIPGDLNGAVSLTFDHILTAVTVKTAPGSAEGRVKSVSLSGIRNRGSFDMERMEWTVADETTAYTFADIDMGAGGSVLVGGESTLMMIPQDFADGHARLTAEIETADGTVRNVDAVLTGAWEAGKAVSYAISLKGIFRFEDMPQQVDAHYEIATFKINASVGAGVPWTLYASASDGADVTVQLEKDVSPFVRDEGFWLDRCINAAGADTGSARGQSSLSGEGPGIYTVYAFMPENPGYADRVVTMRVVSEGVETEASFVQLCPSDRWERVDDKHYAEYGFLWDRVAVYIYPYTYTIGATSIKNEAKRIWNELVSRYNAQLIAEGPFEYTQGLGTRRVYFKINYTKLNSLANLSESDGYGNTSQLYDFGGSAATGTFENAVFNMKKTEAGHETEKMFRWPANNDPSGVAKPVGEEWSPGMDLFANNGLSIVLKRNRYNLVTTTENVGSAVATVTAPKISAEDIVWYWPAVGEYASAPADISGWLNPGDSWSSTPSTSPNSLLGNGSAANRTTRHLLRVRRR